MTALIWITAMVAANLSASHFGPISTIPNALLFIGLDLTLRDRIHDKWAGKGLWPKMIGLVATAGLVTWFISRDAGIIAIASSVALVLSQLADAIVYAMGERWRKFFRVNGSNVASAIVDSVAFPTIAFGGFIWWATLGQALAKIFGGLLWYPIVMRKTAVAALILLPLAASGQSVEVHHDIDRELQTINLSTFKPYEVGNLFAWADVDIDDGSRTAYGEASFTERHGFTAEYNGGVDRDAGTIENLGLFGFEWSRIRLLYRTDGEPQLTYYWRLNWHRFEFAGFVDVWGSDGDAVVLSEPQLWYRINSRMSVGGEVEVSNNFVFGVDGWQVKPTVAVRINL